MNDLEPHPIANELPWMNEDEYQSFKNGMKEHGYDKRHPITLYQGKILDGRHRWKACKELGIEPVFEDFHENGRSPARFVIDENLIRRHLTVSQRAVASLSIYDNYKTEFMVKDRDGIPTEFKGKCNNNRATRVGEIFGIGRTAVQAALRIRKHSPHLIPQIMNGSMTLSRALKGMPKIRAINNKLEDKLAFKALKEFDPKSLTMPLVFDSYEKFMGDHRRALNDAGYIMQVVMCARKIYVQVIPQDKNFKTWMHCRCEYDYRLAVVGAMKDSIKI